MNYKLLFPTYRNRYLFVRRHLRRMGQEKDFNQALNLGTGEGDYDQMISQHCRQLTSCDINEEDIAYARQLNAGNPKVTYRVEDALNLSFADNTFDLVVSVDVIEHVGQPERMVEEVQRVLKPEGVALITFPSLDFPLTYDPVNRILSWFGDQKIPQGAYAFGHEYLVSKDDFRVWSGKNHLKVLQEQNLSGYIIGLLEMYWTGFIQRLFKVNSTNLKSHNKKNISLRPSAKEPALSKVTDAIIALDHKLFGKSRASVGKGFIVQKKN
jgi:ubiquinone/menaquinone biosynthesis C-methylase UbiE